MSPPPAPRLLRLFLSYGRDEHASLAERIKHDLEARGHHVWFDLSRLQPGGDWERYIEDGLNWVAEEPANGRVVLLMTPHSVRRPDGYCLNEIARALARGLRVVPVMVVPCEPPLSICRVQWLDMRDCVPVAEREERYAVKFARLVEALEQDQLDFEGGQARLLRLLEPLPFDADLSPHLERFTGRRWVFDRIDRWLADQRGSRVFWVVGDPGTGKTAIASWLCANRREVAAFHFCRHGHVQKADPRRAILSIAYQLASQLPALADRLSSLNLERIIPESNARTLFDTLLVQPLSGSFPHPGRVMVTVIDALDEATQGGVNELAALIGSEWQRTPSWLRLLITSRAVSEVTRPLQGLEPNRLDTSSPENERDLREFLTRELAPFAGPEGVSADVVDVIVRRSEGLFLYAEWVRQELALGRLALDRLDAFPRGLGGVYTQFFERQFPDTNFYEDRVAPALEVVAAAREPLEVSTLASLFNWDEREQARFCRSVGSLFPVAGGRIQPFHRSVMEWLTTEERADRFFVSSTTGHRRLAERGWQEYQKGIASLSRYALAHLPTHLARAERWGEVETILTDRNFLGAQVDAGMMFTSARDVATALGSPRPMARVMEAIIEVVESRQEETLRQQLRSALHQTFGPYPQWSEEVRAALERSESHWVSLFLGDTLDKEGRHEQAADVYRRLLERTDPGNASQFATVSVKLAIAHDHLGRRAEALALLAPIVNAPSAIERYGNGYWWALYHTGVNLRRLELYHRAVPVLEKLRNEALLPGHRTGALHQMGIIDLDAGNLDEAERKFRLTLSERRDDPWNYRRAYGFRRLGQICALRGDREGAERNFKEAIDISLRCGESGYVVETREDEIMYLELVPRFLREQPEIIAASDLAARPDLTAEGVTTLFHLLARKRLWYIEVVDERTGRPTGTLARFDVAHRDGLWHAGVVVLIVDGAGRLLLQQRGERDSHGRWDVSVAGHLDIGDRDVDAATREAAEELGVVVGVGQLKRIGEPFGFAKQGAPDTAVDRHEGPASYVYRTEKVNRERISMFLARLPDEEIREIRPSEHGAMAVRWVEPMEAVREAEREPGRWASSFKQLFGHDETGAAILRAIDEIRAER